MNLLDLMIKVGVDDQASGGIDKIAGNVKSVAQNITSSLKVALDVGTKVAAATTGAFSLITKQAVNSYAEYEQLVGGVDTLFKESSKTIQGFADQAYITAGISANKYMEQATAFSARLLQTLGGDTAKAAEMVNQAITDMSDNANKMGTDLSRIQDAYQGFAKGNYTMLDNLKLGYGGTQGEMARLLNDANKLDNTILGKGVVLPEEALPGKSQLEGVGLDQIIRGIKVIQDNLGITGTTAKEAMGTITGSLNMAKSAWQNMLTAIANDNADFGSSVGALVSSVEVAFSNLIPRIETSFSGLADLVAAIGPMVAESLPGMLESFLPGLTDGVTAIFTSLAETLPGLVDVLLAQLPTMLASLQDVGTILIESSKEIVGNLITALTDAFKDATGIDLAPLIESITLAITTLQEAFSGIMENVDWEAVTTVINGALTTIAGAITTVITAMQGEAFQKFVGTIKDFFDSVKGGLQTILTPVADGVKKLFEAFTGGDAGVVQSIADAFGAFAKWFEGSLAPAIATVATAIADLLEPFAEGVGTLITEIGDALGEVFQYATEGKASPLQRISDSFQKLVDAFKPHLSETIKNIAESLGNFFEALGTGIIDRLSAFADALEKGDGFISSLLTHIGETITKISEFVLTLTDSTATTEEKLGKLGEVFGTVFSKIKEALKEAVDFVIQKFNALKSFIENFSISAAIDGLKQKTSDALENIKSGWNAFWSGAEKGHEEDQNRSTARSTYATPTAQIPYNESVAGKSTADLANTMIAGAIQTGSKTVNINTNIDGQKVAQVVYDPLSDVVTQKGVPVGG